VEIGSWWGKSAMLLATLARLHDLGPLLCVDPWSDSLLPQLDAALVDDSLQSISAERAFDVFSMNLLPVAAGRVNYLRMPSVVAAERYRQSPEVANPYFGSTRYSGRIALLHIDGNHDLAAVRADIQAWGPLLRRDGAWVVFDDYRWPYGSGPRVVADQFCQEHHEGIGCAFAMGGALFVGMLADS
jgi:hypothetical protein